MSALMTTKEAAHYLAVAPYALHRDRATGRLKVPFVRLGTAIRYRPETLDQWIKEHESMPSKVLERRSARTLSRWPGGSTAERDGSDMEDQRRARTRHWRWPCRQIPMA